MCREKVIGGGIGRRIPSQIGNRTARVAPVTGEISNGSLVRTTAPRQLGGDARTPRSARACCRGQCAVDGVATGRRSMALGHVQRRPVHGRWTL